jgi:ABC-type molybdenum transport system ATPase subunit/photorepair protein PhrA
MTLVKLENALFRVLSDGARPRLFPRPITLEIAATQRWAITGSRKTDLLEILASKHISEPPLARQYPFLEHQFWPSQVTELIEFSNAQIKAPHLSARYESLREDLDSTLNQELLNVKNNQREVDMVLERFSLKGIEHRWIVGLSNGQGRRARLARAILRNPRLLLIDEPFAGLDPVSRKQTSQILESLPPHPHVVVGLRYQDEFPSWITHVAITDANGMPAQGTIAEIEPMLEGMRAAAKQRSIVIAKPKSEPSQPIFQLNDISVSYRGERIFSNLSWIVREGEKWHLRGDNGTGKSTLLSLLTADHPQSWNSSIVLFGKPRETGKQSYFSINEKIGHASPEIHSLFPRNLTVKQALSTGFVVGSYLPLKKLSRQQEARIAELIEKFGLIDDAILGQLAVSEQKVVMFLRAVCKRPDLLILDEAFSAMTEERIEQCKQYINQYDGTVIAVGHIEDEVPLCDKYIRLLGNGVEIGAVDREPI